MGQVSDNLRKEQEVEQQKIQERIQMLVHARQLQAAATLAYANNIQPLLQGKGGYSYILMKDGSLRRQDKVRKRKRR